LGHRSEVETFISGAQLMEHLATGGPLPDLFILDYMMPQMDGCELLTQIRTHPRTGHIPAVFHTAVDDDQIFQRMRRCGADDYWIKSRVDMATIDSKIRQMLLSRISGEGPVQFHLKQDEESHSSPDATERP